MSPRRWYLHRRGRHLCGLSAFATGSTRRHSRLSRTLAKCVFVLLSGRWANHFESATRDAVVKLVVSCSRSIAVVAAIVSLPFAESAALGQRLLGIDISAYQTNLSASNWTTLHTTNSRDFVFIRSSRGGTTGFDHILTDTSSLSGVPADCNGVSATECMANRYDDPYFKRRLLPARRTPEASPTAARTRQTT